MIISFQRPLFWFAALGFALAGVAQAHDPLQSWTTVSLKDGGIEVQTTMASYAAQSLLENGARRPPLISDNFEDYLPELQQAALGLFVVTAAGEVLAPKDASVELTEELDIEFHVYYPPPGAGPWRIRVTYLDRMPEGFVSSVFVEDNAHKSLAWDDLNVERIYLDVPSQTVPAVPARPSAVPTAVLPPMRPQPAIPPWKFVGLGMTNLLTGFGHLAFLSGLLVAGRKLRPVVAVTLCFALGYSITLAFDALNLITTSSHLVDPLIAISIMYVGIENLVRRDEPKGRWGTAFAFGLIHGLGFAQALRVAAASSRRVPVAALVSFNLGLELAQAAVAVLFLFGLWKMRSSPALARAGTVIVSTVISALGAYWLVQRIFFS